ncbi:Emopamil binding protein-domain-containing protein [Sporodiniella umbellata]|nr:Emopamil binding protein-domain-containing protein [Sporodiniella umbellata]
MNHPYYPKDTQLWNYIPNDKSTLELIVTFGSLVVFINGLFYYRWGQHSGSPFKFSWFVTCAWLHCGFELYYILNVGRLPAQNSLWAQLWKEYGKGDSRYMIVDNELLVMEIMTTVIYGPLCILTAYFVVLKSKQQYVFQLIVSVCHMASCIHYYLAELPNASHCDPSPIYFWGYFVLMNAPWIIVPAMCIIQSYKHIQRAFETKDKIKQ